MIEKYIRHKLFLWHKKNYRDFPWRHTKDPYKIMIAEFMLHRTKAEQVVPVYLEFIEKYIDIKILVRTNFEDIKKVTEHLGLHWRARHFSEAAKYVADNYKGKFPEDYNGLKKIPGVGEYIAGAILTVCFNKPSPVVDSNIARFINRYFSLNLSGEIRRKKKIVELSAKLFEYENPGDLLFAIVDFTSLICKPGKPLCKKCPLKNDCKYINGPSPDYMELNKNE
jgi:A/G-specific adenine glycosylase